MVLRPDVSMESDSGGAPHVHLWSMGWYFKRKSNAIYLVLSVAPGEGNVTPTSPLACKKHLAKHSDGREVALDGVPWTKGVGGQRCSSLVMPRSQSQSGALRYPLQRHDKSRLEGHCCSPAP